MDALSSSAARGLLMQNYTEYFAFVLLYYDHCLTFADEVNCIWKHPKSTSSIGFLLLRYIAFVTNIAFFVDMFDEAMSKKSCRLANLAYQVCIILTEIIVGILQLLRVYALYNRSLRILVVLVSAAVLLGASGLLLLFVRSTNVGEAVTDVGILGCHGYHPSNSDIHLAAPWEALLIWDAFILALTVFRTHDTRTRCRSFFRDRLPLLSLLFRDGAVYFGVMLLAQFANIFTIYFESPFAKGSMSTFASNISVTMMTRLMLNLHHSTAAGGSTEPSTTMAEGLVLTSRIGDMDGSMWSGQSREVRAAFL